MASPRMRPSGPTNTTAAVAGVGADLPALSGLRPATGPQEIDPGDAALDAPARGVAPDHDFDAELTTARYSPALGVEVGGDGTGGGDAELEVARLIGRRPDEQRDCPVRAGARQRSTGIRGPRAV